MSLSTWGLDAAERGWIPDTLVRTEIRRLCSRREEQGDRGNCEANREGLREFMEQLRHSPVALVPEAANQQHYEVPAGFFQRVLGPHLKYSCGYWAPGTISLADAEATALRVTCDRAQLSNGQTILELGCGWGSLTLWMATHFPLSRIVAVSNSRSQKQFIDAMLRVRRLQNVTVVTADMNSFRPHEQFDRVVSVEMFEHMRNYEELLSRIAAWLLPGGQLFVHIFSHRDLAYPFECDGDNDWMARHFFTGGIMPSDDLLTHFQRDLELTDHWRWRGTHYEQTSNAWLRNLDRHRDIILSVLASTYGDQPAHRWLHRWRIFFMACAELFGYRGGDVWGISHYLFRKR